MFSLEVELSLYPCPLPPSSPSQIPSYQRLTYLSTSFLLFLMSYSLFVCLFCTRKGRSSLNVNICPFLFISQNSPVSSSHSLSDSAFLFTSTVIACICVFICTYMPKYSLLNLYNVTRTYVFRADLLTPHNSLVCSSLGKVTSPAPSFTSCL